MHFNIVDIENIYCVCVYTQTHTHISAFLFVYLLKWITYKDL